MKRKTKFTVRQIAGFVLMFLAFIAGLAFSYLMAVFVAHGMSFYLAVFILAVIGHLSAAKVWGGELEMHLPVVICWGQTLIFKSLLPPKHLPSAELLEQLIRLRFGAFALCGILNGFNWAVMATMFVSHSDLPEHSGSSPSSIEVTSD